MTQLGRIRQSQPSTAPTSPRRCDHCLGRRRRTQSSGSQAGLVRPDIHLGRNGSETTVKPAAPDYRVVFFATHGLVAGEGFAEPSLALTLPQQSSELGNAPLTAK
jgi:hypothetical protein